MADLRIERREPPSRTTWRTSDLLRAAVVFAAVYVVAQFLWFASNIIFVAFLGVLFGIALSAGVDRLNRHGIPRVVGTAGIVLGVVGLLVLFGALAAPTAREQVEELRVQLPEALDRLEAWVDEQDGVLRFLIPLDTADEEPDEELEEDLQEAPEEEPAEPGPADDEPPAPSDTLREQLAQQLGDLGEHLFAFLTSTVAVLGGILLILFIAIYTAVDPGTYRRGILLLVPLRVRAKADEVMGETSYMLRRWLVTQAVTMVVVGTVTTVGLMILDVRAALALGILAGLLEFIPIFGPIIAAIPAIAMGFLESPQMALYVLIFYVVIQQLESQLLVPVLMKEGIDLPPILTVLAQAMMAILFGFLGLLVAVPLVAVAIIVVKMLYVQEVVGEQVVLPREAHD